MATTEDGRRRLAQTQERIDAWIAKEIESADARPEGETKKTKNGRPILVDFPETKKTKNGRPILDENLTEVHHQRHGLIGGDGKHDEAHRWGPPKARPRDQGHPVVARDRVRQGDQGPWTRS